MKIKQIFTKNEQGQLFGERKGRLWLMAFLMLIAVVSIGFATASLEYLKDKMSNPFVSCVDIVVDQIWSNGEEELEKFVSDSINENLFHYNSSEKVWLLSAEFQKEGDRSVRLDGRTIYMNSPILNGTIFSEDNLICKKDSITDADFGIILSNEGLKKLGISQPVFLILPVYIDDSTSCEIAVPVLAIVKELPDMCDFLMTHAYAKHIIKTGADYFNVSTSEYNKWARFVCKNNVYEDVVAHVRRDGAYIITKADNNPYDSCWSADYSYFEVQTDSVADYVYQRFMYDSLLYDLRKEFADIYRVYELGGEASDTATDARMAQIYSCYFEMNKDLPDNVENFRVALKESSGHRLDMSKIDSLKNLAKVQTLGNILSLCMVLIAIIFMIVFIYFLMNMHFQKIQKNLGTFKAFGIDTNTLKEIYVSIIVKMVVIAFTMAVAVAAAISIPINIYLPREGVYAWVNIFTWQNGVLLIVSLIAAVLTVVFTANKLLKNSPGDLIYDRKH